MRHIYLCDVSFGRARCPKKGAAVGLFTPRFIAALLSLTQDMAQTAKSCGLHFFCFFAQNQAFAENNRANHRKNAENNLYICRYRAGEMQIVSGAMGRKTVHFEAPAPQFVKSEMDKFLDWFNQNTNLDPVLKAGIAHFWFIIIHPFDDGNGRIARAITDLQLSRSENSAERFYSMSSQIRIERKRYYQVLESCQHSNGDITEWLEWFLQCLKNALLAAESKLEKLLHKINFWQQQENTPLNSRQRLMLNKILDQFEGNLSSSKWAQIAKCSPDTALRDIQDLVQKGILRQTSAGGRSTSYELV